MVAWCRLAVTRHFGEIPGGAKRVYASAKISAPRQPNASLDKMMTHEEWWHVFLIQSIWSEFWTRSSKPSSSWDKFLGNAPH